MKDPNESNLSGAEKGGGLARGVETGTGETETGLETGTGAGGLGQETGQEIGDAGGPGAKKIVTVVYPTPVQRKFFHRFLFSMFETTIQIFPGIIRFNESRNKAS